MDGSMTVDGMPFKTQPHDAMRLGLASLKEDALATHPVEHIQRAHTLQATEKQYDIMRQLYGTAVPAKLQIETQILAKFVRLPGLHSSRLGLESMTGELDEFSFESYLNLPENNDSAPPDMHSQMEKSLGLGMKPVARGMI